MNKSPENTTIVGYLILAAAIILAALILSGSLENVAAQIDHLV